MRPTPSLRAARGAPGSIALVALAGCASEFALEDQTRVDVFPQVRVNAVDLLLVIDNSGSMVEEQQHLADSFEALITSLDQGESDWRVGVTTTEASLEGYRGLLAGGTDEIVLVSPDGEELDRVAWDDTTTSLAADVVVERDASGAPGPLVISRWLPWPAVTGCEWVEITNVGDGAAHLSDHLLRDDGRDSATFPAGTVVAPGQAVRVGRSTACETPFDVVLEEGFSLAHGVRWVDRDTEDAATVFGDLVSVGTSGFGLEMGLENARLALTSEKYAVANRGFLRGEADLSLLFVSDEDDISHDPVADYVDVFKELKGDYRDRERVRFGVVAGIDPPGDPLAPSCASDLGNAAWAERYVAFARMTGALRRSICDDLSTIAVDAGLTLSGLRSEFQLSGEPDPASLSVELFDSEEEDSVVDVYEEGVDFDLERRTDEDDDALWLVFHETPPAEHWIVVTYRLLP